MAENPKLKCQTSIVCWKSSHDSGYRTGPLYVMSCFKLSRGFLKDLNMMLAGYQWGDKCSKRRIHWRNWEQLCCSKLDGGLGFRDFESFNLALLAKQWWRVLQNENSLCYKVLKARYFPHLPAYRARHVYNSSYLWKSLMSGKKIVDQRAIWRVGNGEKIDIWCDRWIKKPPTYKLQPIGHIQLTPMKVNQLMTSDGLRWDETIQKEMMQDSNAKLVGKIPLSKTKNEDKLI